jgi:hypothetical protein
MRVLKICAKCNDMFGAILEIDGKVTASHDGYVPDFMPEQHYGDYIELDVDIDTGQILNWKKPTAKQLKQQLNGER